MAHGTGYPRPSSAETDQLMKHRQRQLEALSARAQRSDAAEQQLGQLDREIAAGEAQREARASEPPVRVAIPPPLAGLTVDAIMTRDVMTLQEEDDLLALATDIDLTGHRSFPVVDGERVVGLITHRELLRATHFAPGANELAGQRFVASMMRRSFATVAPGAPVARVAHLLLGHDAPCVLVVDDDQCLRGIVTKDDVLSLLMGAPR
ncbi:MAG: CBS domain-containing protein [Sandaracinaceae bacterium]|nr:CBS domain-containing protein [Sandaracinaceae bacterium]